MLCKRNSVLTSSRAKFTRFKIPRSLLRRDAKAGAMGSQRSMGFGKNKQYRTAETLNKTRPRSHLRWISLIQNLTRGKRICGGFRCVNAHAEQERFELSRKGYSTIIKATNDCHDSEWISWHKRGSDSVRQRCGCIRDGTAWTFAFLCRVFLPSLVRFMLVLLLLGRDPKSHKRPRT